MSVPGSNLLIQALTLIARQSFRYYAFVSKSTNAIGLDVTIYALPMSLSGSVQPVPRRVMEDLGLDLQRNYINVFVPYSSLDIDRDVSGDMLFFGPSTQIGPFAISTDDGTTITTDDGQIIVTDSASSENTGPYAIATDDGFTIITDDGKIIITDNVASTTSASTQGSKYQVLSATRWFLMDYWVNILCVQVP